MTTPVSACGAGEASVPEIRRASAFRRVVSPSTAPGASLPSPARLPAGDFPARSGTRSPSAESHVPAEAGPAARPAEGSLSSTARRLAAAGLTPVEFMVSLEPSIRFLPPIALSLGTSRLAFASASTNPGPDDAARSACGPAAEAAVGRGDQAALNAVMPANAVRPFAGKCVRHGLGAGCLHALPLVPLPP